MAFLGAMIAILASTAVGRTAGRSTAVLLLAGIAVAAFLTAFQTYLMQRSTENLREVYAWIFGRLQTSGWNDVYLLGPYVLVCGIVIFLNRRQLDVLRLGEEEAEALGVNTKRLKWTVLVCASLLTASAVCGEWHHYLCRTCGSPCRPPDRRLQLSPRGSSLSGLRGGVLDNRRRFARTIISPAELPIGVLTAFIGAPFFAVILYTSRRDIL